MRQFPTKRFPARIDSFKVGADSFTRAGLVEVINHAIDDILRTVERPGLLLSGGVDSAALALLLKAKLPTIECFTIGGSSQHPDLISAMSFADQYDFDLRIHVPDTIRKRLKKGEVNGGYPGDEAVLVALEFASKFVTDIIATDGIDEQMGGYWWHVNRTPELPTVESAFEHFWNELEPKHLEPMYHSARKVGISVHWVFLHPLVVEYISRIPLEERVKDNLTKAYWRDAARLIGVPESIIGRPKRGFVHALQ